MNDEIYQNIRTRLITARDTLATANQLRELRDDINQAGADSTMTLEQLGELKELLAEAYVKATLDVSAK